MSATSIIDVLNCVESRDDLSSSRSSVGTKKASRPLHPLALSDIFPIPCKEDSSTLNRGHEHHRSLRRFNAREGRPRCLGGVQHGGGT